MRLFGRLRPLIGGAPAELPPPEVYSALIDDLHAPLFSFITGAATAVLVGAIASWRTENPWLVALTVCTALVAAARILTIAEYRKQRPGFANNIALLRSFERRYAVGATIYAALLGLTALVAYVFTDDPVSFLLITANGVGYAAGATARNSSRPRIAIAQLVVLLVPVVVGTALRPQLAYAVLSLITLLYLISSIEIVRYLAANRLGLLLTTREKAGLARSLAEQNVLFDAALNNMALGLCMFDAGHRLSIANRRFSEIFGIPPEKLAPGTPMRHVMELAQVSDSNPAYAAAAQQRLLADSDDADPHHIGRRAHDLDLASAHAERRYRGDFRGRHRTASGRSARPVPGDPRQPHRPAEPRRVRPRGQWRGRVRRAATAGNAPCCSSISTASRSSTTRSAMCREMHC